MSTSQDLRQQAELLKADITARLKQLDGLVVAPTRHDSRMDDIESKVAAIEAAFEQDQAEAAAELATAEATNQIKEQTQMKSTTDMVKDNATIAAKTAGANVVNKKLVAVARKQLKDLGFDPAFLDTQLGRDLATNLLPIALYALATTPAVGNVVPHADKVARVAEFASQGALNESFDRLIQAVVPFLNEFAQVADDVDITDTDDEKVRQLG